MQKLLAWITNTIKKFEAKMEHLEHIKELTAERENAVMKLPGILINYRLVCSKFERRGLPSTRFTSLEERAKDRILYLDNIPISNDPEEPSYCNFARHVNALERYIKEMHDILQNIH